MKVDGHVHVACLNETLYPRQLTGLGTRWWEAGGTADLLVAAMDANQVARAVLVQPLALYGYDCRCAIDTVAADRARLALVGAVDPATADPAEALTSLASAGATGVRVSAVGGAADWLQDSRGADIWAAASAADLVVVVNVGPQQLMAIGELCARAPSTSVVLDHCGFSHFDNRPDDPRIYEFATIPNTHIKVTTHNLTAPDSAIWLASLATAFGANRLCWGSDYPQLQGHSYAEMTELAERAVVELDGVGRRAFLAETSRRLWWR